ncbi:MAG: hypothetical protein ACHRXM_28395 [Isosphaerales bacterium]
MELMTKTRIALISAAIVAILFAGLAFEVVTTQPVRGAMRTCSELFTIANRLEMANPARPEETKTLLEAASALCSARYRRSNPLIAAAEGGLVGIPRNINKNFKAWREGPNVWICTTNRIGPVYQFVFEDGRWRFDGLVAILRPWGEIVRSSELADPDVEGCLPAASPDGPSAARPAASAGRRD